MIDNRGANSGGMLAGRWKFLILLALVAAGTVTLLFTPVGSFFSEAGLKELLASVRESWWSPFMIVAMLAIAAPLGIPTTPLLLGGAAFGVLLGSFYNTLGLILGAAVSYELARALGRDFVLAVTGDRVRGIERRFQRFAFWPLVQLNFAPLPFPVLNFGAALSGVPRPLFLCAMTAGLIPSTILHTYFLHALVEAQWDKRGLLLGLYIGVFLLFNVVTGYPWVRRQQQRRHAYKHLKLLRSKRGLRLPQEDHDKDRDREN